MIRCENIERALVDLEEEEEECLGEGLLVRNCQIVENHDDTVFIMYTRHAHSGGGGQQYIVTRRYIVSPGGPRGHHPPTVNPQPPHHHAGLMSYHQGRFENGMK